MFTEMFTEMVKEPSWGKTRNGSHTIDLPIIGATGFEPATSCSRSRRATELRYAPLCLPSKQLTPRPEPLQIRGMYVGSVRFSARLLVWPLLFFYALP